MLGDGNDHFDSPEELLDEEEDDACMAFKRVTDAFQLRHLSNVVRSVEHVITSGDISSFYNISVRKRKLDFE